MGNSGGILIYALENRGLVRYETSLFDDENLYLETERLILKHQNNFEHDNIESREILFDYHDGGMGNHVFINKKIELNKEKDFFTFKLEGDIYTIHSSALGVFYLVAKSIENMKKTEY